MGKAETLKCTTFRYTGDLDIYKDSVVKKKGGGNRYQPINMLIVLGYSRRDNGKNLGEAGKWTMALNMGMFCKLLKLKRLLR